MEAEARYTLVGMVVLAVATMGVMAILWIAGKTDHMAYRYYTIYFRTQSMDGLDVDSAVKMRGIKVGMVSEFDFSTKPDDAVKVLVRVSEQTPVREGVRAYVKRNIVTGLASIELTNVPDHGKLLTEAPPGEDYPVIAEGSSDLDKVASAVSKMAENGAQVLDKINRLLSEENQAHLAATFANLEEISSHLVDSRESLDAAVQGIRDASDEFRFAGASIAQAATRAEGSITDVGENAQTALKEAARTLESLQMETRLISDKLQALSDAGTQELGAMSRDVRTAADSVTVAGQKLSNPKALLLGPGKQQLGPGEK